MSVSYQDDEIKIILETGADAHRYGLSLGETGLLGTIRMLGYDWDDLPDVEEVLASFAPGIETPERIESGLASLVRKMSIDGRLQ
jgi:hypothetical protein